MDPAAAAKNMQQETVRLRRELHRIPEVSFREKDTSAFVRRYLESLGIPCETVGEYNVIGTLSCGGGRRIALRADMDALPVTEQTDVPFRSCRPGVMHACGHDGHMAAVLAAAKILSEHRDELGGTVYFVFQQAEESGGGAGECVEYLQAAGGVDNVIGMHVLGTLPSGTLDLSAGPRFSGNEAFTIEIRGRGGHGSRPDLAADPIRIGCMVRDAVTSLPVYSHSLHRTCLVAVCSFRGGNRFNIFPDSALLEGSVRYYREKDLPRILRLMEQRAKSIASLYGADAVLTHTPAAKYPCYNHPADAARGARVARSLGIPVLEGCPPQSASDNFAEFTHTFPGFYMFLGVSSPRPGTSGILHASNFDLDEGALETAVAFYAAYVKAFLEETV